MKYLLICAGLLLIVFHSWGQERLADRIAPPSGYVRETCSDNSFTTYLRNLPLLPKGSKVLLYNGKEKANQAAAFAVVDMEIGNRDLQQCADAVIRLRAEYLWKHKRYADIKFNFTSGFTAEYKKWAEGNRIKVNDNQVQWYASGKGVDYSYKTFRNYLDMVFMYAGTACCDCYGCCHSSEYREESISPGTKLYACPTDSYPGQSNQPQPFSLVRADGNGCRETIHSGMDF